MATVELQKVTTTYGSTVAIDELDLAIDDGEFFVILGPSGAGKTTTLKSVAGLLDSTTGEVRIGGRSMGQVEPYDRNVAMAFESYALYPQKTVAENLASPLKSGRTGTYSATERSERIDQVTTTLGINHLQQRFPRELSNGQRQRVALGRVLVRPADVYLLDEPLSHLDAKLRAAMRAELKQLGQMSNTTTLYVTHDYQEALALGDRIGVLRAGKLVQVGTPTEIWRTPVDTFVARALGQPEMNLLPARLDDGRLLAADGAVEVRLTDDVGRTLGLSPGSRASIGLRPRDVDLAEESPDDGDSLEFRGTVELAERLGRDIELTVAVGGETVVAVTSNQRVAEHDEVTLRVAIANVHLFAATGSDDPNESARRLGSPLAAHPRSSR